MTKGSDNVYPKLILGPLGAPSAPADASWKIYPMADGIYAVSSNAAVGPFGSGASLPTLLKDRVVLTSASLTVTNTSFEDAAGLSITGTTGARRCLVGFTGFVYHGSNQAGVYIQLDIDGTDQGGAFGMTGETTVSGGNDAHNASFVYMTDTLTAASHTFKIQWRVTSGTGNMYASTDVPATFWVAELL